MSEKLQQHHLDRHAFVYVRQSTGHQVRNHLQGRQRQYDLSDRARELGFSQVKLIDEDQGKSGSGLVDRPGFAALLSAVCEGKAGAVFALEASRLARNNRDWHHLIDLCALTATVIIDGEGIYDPREVNDRLLLGLKGSLAEFELSLLRQRAREAFEMKVAAGHAMWELPVGFIRNEVDRIEKIADRRVQAAITGVFGKFRELGSARQAALWYCDHQMTLPEAIHGTRSKEIVWRPASETHIRQILKNPCYAGALAYGRTEAVVSVDGDRARKSKTRRFKPQEKWKVLIRDNHAGYITWQEYLENISMLESNAASREPSAAGVAKKGSALLGGLLRCRHCGRKMFVGYSGKGNHPRYSCHGDRQSRGSAACQSVGGRNLDRRVAEVVLEAIQPAGIEAALDAMQQYESQLDEKRRSLEMSLEQARFKVDRARRQYDLVDPANRLVASELEARWNSAMEHVSTIERQLRNHTQERIDLSDEQQVRLLELGRDLQSLWNASSATDDLKKRILRSVLVEIVIGDDQQRENHQLVLHWKGGTHTELSVPRNKRGKKFSVTSKTALELIEELSKVCSDQTIASTLNRLGIKTGAGKTWRVHSVHCARHNNRLTNHHASNDWLTVQQTSEELGVSRTVVLRLIRERTLPAQQVLESTPWIIDRESLQLPAVQAAVAAVQEGRALTRPDPQQAEFPFK